MPQADDLSIAFSARTFVNLFTNLGVSVEELKREQNPNNEESSPCVEIRSPHIEQTKRHARQRLLVSWLPECDIQSRMPDFWHRAYPKLEKNGVNFVYRVNKNSYELYMISQQHFNVTNGKLVYCFRRESFFPAKINVKKVSEPFISPRKSVFDAETHLLYKQSLNIASI